MAQQELSLETLVDSETDMKTLGMWEARSTDIPQIMDHIQMVL